MTITPWCLLALGLTPEEIAENSLTTAGWCVMLISISAVLGLLLYCLVKTLSLPAVAKISEEELAKSTVGPADEL